MKVLFGLVSKLILIFIHLILNLVSRVVNEIENLCLKIDEFKLDYDKRISGIVFDNELNKMILSNSKAWLFNSLINSSKELYNLFYEWKDSAQKNVDGSK